jgi:hypothetical protein
MSVLKKTPWCFLRHLPVWSEKAVRRRRQVKLVFLSSPTLRYPICRSVSHASPPHGSTIIVDIRKLWPHGWSFPPSSTSTLRLDFQLTSTLTCTTGTICLGYPVSMIVSRRIGLPCCLGEYDHFLLSNHAYVQDFSLRSRIRTCISFILAVHTCIFHCPTRTAMHDDAGVPVISIL